jgi:hypothetical protein
MSAAIGQIVYWQGEQWVVAGHSGSPRPVPYARLLRPGRDGNWRGETAYADSLAVLSTPTFAIGDRVRVDGLPGEIVAAAPQEHAGETMWVVRLDRCADVAGRIWQLVS